MLRGVAAVFAAAMAAAVPAAMPAGASEPPYSHVAFERARVDTAEGNDLLVVTVVREQSLLATEGRVDFRTEPVEATEGTDYEGSWGTLVFAPGQNERSIVVRVHDDDEAEGVESFRVVLSNPRGSIGSAGGPTTIWLVDDDSQTAPPASVGVQASERVATAEAARPVVRRRVTTVRRRVSRPAQVAAPVEPPTVPLQIVPGSPGVARTSPVPVLAAFAAVLLGRVLATFWLRRRLFTASQPVPGTWPAEPPPLA